MRVVMSVVFLIVGSMMVGFAPRIVRARAALHFSTEELAAREGPAHARVRRTTVVGTFVCVAIGVFWLYAGIAGLLK